MAAYTVIVSRPNHQTLVANEDLHRCNHANIAQANLSKRVCRLLLRDFRHGQDHTELSESYFRFLHANPLVVSMVSRRIPAVSKLHVSILLSALGPLDTVLCAYCDRVSHHRPLLSRMEPTVSKDRYWRFLLRCDDPLRSL